MLVGNAAQVPSHVSWSRSTPRDASAHEGVRHGDGFGADLLRVKAALTPSDREFILATTGVRITHDERPMPLLAFEIASDRRSGVLPAGQPITTGYVTAVVEKFTAQAEDPLGTAEYLEVATGYLAARNGAASVDFLG